MTIRLDPHWPERFRRIGVGRQLRINAALRDWLAETG